MNFSQHRRTRSDATRNRDTIIEATATTLNENPRASMREIAVAAGVSRATLYGHFPTRQALVVTTLRRVLSEANARLAGLDPELSPEDAVDSFVATSWRLIGQFDGLSVAADREVNPRELRRLHDKHADQVRRLIVRGRDGGAFRIDQSLDWQVECVYAIVRAGSSLDKSTGTVRVDPAAAMVTTIRAVLAAVPEESEAATLAPQPQPVGRL